MAPTLLLAISALATAALAQQTIYSQCGGINWTGGTTCAAGLDCVVLNSYYYQCLPGPTSSSRTSSASTVLSTKTISTTSKASSASATTSSVVSQPTGWKYFITFGDSYSQTGFSISSTKATAGNILGNPPFPGYTTTGGNNWIDDLIATYNSSLVLSYNFAYGGATVDSTLVAPYLSTVLSLVNQVAEFQSNLSPPPSYAPWTATNTLFGIWIGVNDVGNGHGSSNWPTLAATVVARYISQVQLLYNAGARRFLFLTVPPTQYTPMVVAEGSATQATWGQAVALFNNLLIPAIASFKASNPGTVTYVYDTTTPFLQAIDNPTQYGSPDATCFNANGVSCLWWNNYHPGQAIHKLVAKGVATLSGI